MRILLVVAMAALVAWPVGAEDGTGALGALISTEKQGLDAAGSSKVAALVEPEDSGAERADRVRYTRAWLEAQPPAKGDKEWRCLAEALYFEARGETIEGQFAVAEVIANRVDSPLYPDTFCGVVRQGTGEKFKCQFTYNCDGRAEVIRDQRAFEQVGKVARAIIDGAPRLLTKGATHYHTLKVRPRWSRVYQRTATIGEHVFYRATRL